NNASEAPRFRSQLGQCVITITHSSHSICHLRAISCCIVGKTDIRRRCGLARRITTHIVSDTCEQPAVAVAEGLSRVASVFDLIECIVGIVSERGQALLGRGPFPQSAKPVILESTHLTCL